MKSQVCYLDQNGKGREQILDEVEQTAFYCDLKYKEVLRMRLLAEEMVGLIQGITGIQKAQFWVETDEECFRLFLCTSVQTEAQMEEKLMELSTEKKKTKGVMGKIRAVVENFINACSSSEVQMMDPALIPSQYAIMSGYYHTMGGMTWSLQHYTDFVVHNPEEQQEECDELEKSIVSKLADDVIVSIHDNNVEIMVKRTFKE